MKVSMPELFYSWLSQISKLESDIWTSKCCFQHVDDDGGKMLNNLRWTSQLRHFIFLAQKNYLVIVKSSTADH